VCGKETIFIHIGNYSWDRNPQIDNTTQFKIRKMPAFTKKIKNAFSTKASDASTPSDPNKKTKALKKKSVIGSLKDKGAKTIVNVGSIRNPAYATEFLPDNATLTNSTTPPTSPGDNPANAINANKHDEDIPLPVWLMQKRCDNLHHADDSSIFNHKKCMKDFDREENEAFWHKIRQALEELEASSSTIFLRSYRDPKTQATAVHLMCQLINPPLDVVKKLIVACGGASCMTKVDHLGHIPLHYALTIGQFDGSSLQFLMKINDSITRAYCSMKIDSSSHLSSNSSCPPPTKIITSPLYRALQLKKPRNTVLLIHQACTDMICLQTPITHLARDGSTIENEFMHLDTPLNLLWRRYHADKWECEKFFPGDNSDPGIMLHRQIFRQQASETRDTMMQMMHLINHSCHFDTENGSAIATGIHYDAEQDCMVSASGEKYPQRGFVVHAAANLATKAPLDWMQVIVAKNPNEIGEQDSKGRLPIHYAAIALGETESGGVGSYQGKFILQYLLRLCPSAAQVMDDSGKVPLTLALERGGVGSTSSGLQALYDANPQAMENVETSGTVPAFKIQAFLHRLETDKDEGIQNLEEEAVFVVQNPGADVHDILGAMWSHKSDPGIQMLSLQTIERMAREGGHEVATRIALNGGISAIVDSMSAHPQEPVVQEKGCFALESLALGVLHMPRRANKQKSKPSTPSGRSKPKFLEERYHANMLAIMELSFSAVGAISTLIRAMQDNPKDALVQAAACRALAALSTDLDSYTQIVSAGGVTSIVHAMDEHTNILQVQRESLYVLQQLIGFSQQSFPMYSSEELGILIESAKEQFPKECGNMAKIILDKLYV